MSNMEVVFFAAAMLIPLVGGSVLLYFLSKGAAKPVDPGKDDPKKE